MTRLFLFFLLAPITLYKWVLSPWLGCNCRFLPTCSDYATEALHAHGMHGMWLAIKRLCRCHPWGGEGIDPVPSARSL